MTDEDMTPYERLEFALKCAEQARRCIAQNRNEYEKDLARDSYDNVLADTLWPALATAVEEAVGDLTGPDLEWISRRVLDRLNKRGLL